MIGVLLVCITIFILSFLMTRSYGKTIRTKINKRDHPLHFLYGLAMYIADKPLRRLTKKEARRLEGSLRRVYGEDKTNEKQYFYIITKYANVIGTLFCVLIFSLLFTISKSQNKIEVLSRNDYGMGEAEYKLLVESEGKKEEALVVVPEYEYSEDEATKLMEGYWEAVILEFLGENESLDKVTDKLKLISTIGHEGIHITWTLDEEGYIDFDGSISKDVAPDGNVISLTATMTLQEYSVSRIISICIYPPSYKESALQQYIDKSDVHSKEVELPTKVDGKNITYRKVGNNYSGIVFFVGVIIAVSLFYLKDRDVKGQLEDRELQLKHDYPELVNKFILLIKAGLPVLKAWEKILDSTGNKTDKYIYREMRITLTKIQSGMPETRAFEEFGRGCGVHCYIRFANLINQNLKRGTSNLCVALEQELYNAMYEKRSAAVKFGEKIGAKLLMPVSALLIISLIIVAAPAFLTLSI